MFLFTLFVVEVLCVALAVLELTLYGEAWERRKIESVFCKIIGLLKSEKKDEVGQTYQKARESE